MGEGAAELPVALFGGVEQQEGLLALLVAQLLAQQGHADRLPGGLVQQGKRHPHQLQRRDGLQLVAGSGSIRLYHAGRQSCSAETYHLKNISLSFFPGAKIGVLGLNGAGKSTLLRIMAGIDKDIEGEARPQPDIKIGYLPPNRS